MASHMHAGSWFGFMLKYGVGGNQGAYAPSTQSAAAERHRWVSPVSILAVTFCIELVESMLAGSTCAW